ncbi:DUF4280 domain-containing protein [Rhodanobacter sp. L36]|uniref:DUF4280 domain-containing protein n=1 Tax=Rhodanobacter sp. L36 TaxID=1747221 RepID=UPI00131E43CB|nr:DUF4280 domain-containing protein [Rhodanobacter sp. L36]
MPIQVVNGAKLMCSFGVAPSTFVVLPLNKVMSGNQPAANILDHVPMTNIMPFGMCSAPTNPTVIAATAAKLGVFSPAPCVPATSSPWIPGAPKVMLGNQLALDNTCTCLCQWLGVVTVSDPGQTTEMIP